MTPKTAHAKICYLGFGWTILGKGLERGEGDSAGGSDPWMDFRAREGDTIINGRLDQLVKEVAQVYNSKCYSV